MLEFLIFRIKVFPSPQQSLFPDERRTPQQILKEAIRTLPELELREGFVWHIGNVAEIEDDALYFRIGRTSKTTIEVFRDGKFLDQEFPVSPYTHAILDIELEICAIARKRRLFRTTNSIANQLRRLLQESEAARKYSATFEVGTVNDPEDFLAHLRNAYSISKFWLTFTRPNAIDANDDFIKPMEKLLREADGVKGKTEIEGEHLDAATLEAIARSAAATGDDAGASIQTNPEEGRVRVSLKGNAAVITHEEPEDEDQKKGLLWKIRETYQLIRQGLIK